MTATAKLRARNLVPPRTIGHPVGLKPGDKVEGRGELDALAVHNRASQGIDCKGGCPAFAICMSGGYVDDDDAGKVITYTGMGGQSGKVQTRDQKLALVRPLTSFGGSAWSRAVFCDCLSVACIQNLDHLPRTHMKWHVSMGMHHCAQG